MRKVLINATEVLGKNKLELIKSLLPKIQTLFPKIKNLEGKKIPKTTIKIERIIPKKPFLDNPKRPFSGNLFELGYIICPFIIKYNKQKVKSYYIIDFKKKLKGRIFDLQSKDKFLRHDEEELAKFIEKYLDKNLLKKLKNKLK